MKQYTKNGLKILLALFLFIASLLFIQTVLAQVEPGINIVGEKIALAEEDPRVIAAKIVRAALGFLGIIALGIVLYGGFVWMTSAGVPEKIDKAKKILTNGLIGLIIIVMAFGITQYILNSLIGAPPGQQVVTPTGPPVIGRYSGALGNGIVESHYPPRGGTGIARNTKIIVTFKEEMSVPSIVTETGALNSENVKIYKSIDGEGAALPSAEVRVAVTADSKTFVFAPVDLLGSPSENIWYSVVLKPGIKKADGSDAFVGAFRDGYAWDFEVSTFIDTTPPQVKSVVPSENSTNPRNIVIQINFDEAMDPTTVSGEWPAPFNFIEVKKADDETPIPGTWQIANQYKTIEFITDEECGTNSCGGTVYCLPPNERPVNVLLLAATLGDAPPAALISYDGITDVAGNSLDGNKNGTAEGSARDGVEGVDNFGLTFNTTDEIDLVPPEIAEVLPTVGASNIALDAPVEMIFTKVMSMRSFNSENIKLEDNQRDECAVWFTLGGTNLKEEPPGSGTFVPVTSLDDEAVRTKAIIYHDDFIESVENVDQPAPLCADNQPVDPRLIMYYPRSTHNVKDIYQNCFFRPVGPPETDTVGECVANPDGTMPSGCEPWR